MAGESQRSHGESTHRVRPRWTWIALLLMLVGLVLIAVAISVQSWTWAVPGLILLAVGAGAGLYGGFFYDVQGGPAGNQLHEVIEGKEYDFPGAGSTRREQDVQRDVRERWLSDDE